jgi:hypothetical protein
MDWLAPFLVSLNHAYQSTVGRHVISARQRFHMVRANTTPIWSLRACVVKFDGVRQWAEALLINPSMRRDHTTAAADVAITSSVRASLPNPATCHFINDVGGGESRFHRTRALNGGLTVLTPRATPSLAGNCRTAIKTGSVTILGHFAESSNDSVRCRAGGVSAPPGIFASHPLYQGGVTLAS